MSDSVDATVEQSKTFDESYVKDLRAEAASYRVKAKEIQEQYDTFKQEVANEKKKHQMDEVLRVAESKGVVDPSIIPQLLEGKLEEGTDAYEAIDQLLSDKPYLKQGTIGKPSSPAENTSKVKLFTKEEVARMSPTEVNQNWEQIQQQLSEGSI